MQMDEKGRKEPKKAIKVIKAHFLDKFDALADCYASWKNLTKKN
jgi:hypothetical protein